MIIWIHLQALRTSVKFQRHKCQSPCPWVTYNLVRETDSVLETSVQYSKCYRRCLHRVLRTHTPVLRGFAREGVLKEGTLELSSFSFTVIFNLKMNSFIEI